jgi:HK97 family phage portal protein
MWRRSWNWYGSARRRVSNMSLFSILGAEVKALHRFAGPRDLFARSQSYSIGSSLVSQSNSLDLERIVADPLHNGVVAACVNAIARALPDAPLVLENRTPQGWKSVEEHPCLDILHAPNPDHSDADVWGLTSGYKATRGQAFWLLLPNSRGEVGEIHVWNPDRVTVLGDEENFISGYRVQRESRTHFLADKQQIIHFRHLPDFANPRLGWSPLRTGRAQIAGDNVAASYHTSILFNAGVVSLLVSLKEGAMSGQVTPEQFQTVLTNLRRAGRERAGGIEGINLPLEVHKLAYSPDEMNVDKLIEYYETRICCVMGVSQRVAGLGSDPTYNNLGEALNDFWERRIVPDRNADAATLNRQWLPLWGLDGGAWRFRFDYSNVPALQENRDALHARVRADWEKGLVDKQQARALLGYGTENDGEFARVFYGDESKTATAGTEGSALEMKVWEESEHPRDEIGRFTNGSYNPQSLDLAMAMRQSARGMGNASPRGDLGSVSAMEADPLAPDSIQRIANLGSSGQSASSPLSTPSEAQQHLIELLLKENTNISNINKETFARGLSLVVQRIPAHLHPIVVDRVRSIAAFDSLDKLRLVGSAFGLSDMALGGYDPNLLILWIDGAHWGTINERGETPQFMPHIGIYAHELTHSLDSIAALDKQNPHFPASALRRKGHFPISATSEWVRCHDLDQMFSPFSTNAQRSPKESFAEIGRVLFSSPEVRRAIAYCEDNAPNSFEFWKRNKLFP